MTALCPEDAKLCELAQFCRHGASFYPEVIRQFLTVEGDSEVIGTLHLCLIVQVRHQLFPGSLAGGIFDLLVQIHIVLGNDSQQIANQRVMKFTAVVFPFRNITVQSSAATMSTGR